MSIKISLTEMTENAFRLSLFLKILIVTYSLSFLFTLRLISNFPKSLMGNSNLEPLIYWNPFTFALIKLLK